MTQNLAEQLEPAEPPVNEEVVEEQAEQKPEAEAKPEAEEEKKKDPSEKNVPHGAFHEERERRKQAERELTQLRQQQAVLADRYQQLYGALNQQQQPQIPPKDVDPLANMDARLEQAERAARQLYESQQQEYRRQQAEHNERAFRAHVGGMEQEFAKSTPDYIEALQFVAGRRRTELEAAGYPAQQVAAMVDRDAMMLAWDAVQQGRNPAEVIYNMAVSTGYTKKQQAEQKVEALQKGTQAAKSLGNGAAPAGLPTMEQIANMDEDEFARFKADLSKKGMSLQDVMK
jgi:hypothetical protein